MTFKRLLGLATAMVAVAVLVGSVGAGAARTPAKPALNLSTNAKVREYLRSLGISPRGVVIQRGVRNYAGPRCPGKRWTCTRSHRVVQIAKHRGKNSFRCSAKRCVVVQATKSLLATNTAKCIRTTGITQSCSITQSSTGDNNDAIVYMDATKLSGLTQNASQTAQIVQTAGAGVNRACVFQRTTIDGSTVAKRGVPVNVNLNAHQTIGITQDSLSGGNTVQNATNSGGGACAAGALDQKQTITSKATGTMSITQNQNATDAGPNQVLDIAQNRSSGFFGDATGANVANFNQTNTLTAIANTPVGPVSQTQSSLGGGILAKVNQDSRDQSTANATQTETQCEDAATSGLTECARGSLDTLPFPLTQVQYGPEGVWKMSKSRGRHFYSVKKAPGDSSQTGNSGDSFTVTQTSQQDNDTFSGQTNVIQAGFHTDGTGTINQTATIDGQTSSDTQGGSGDVTGSLTCTGTSCTSTPPRNGNVLIAGTGDLGSTEPNDNLAQALTSAGYSVTESASLPADLSSFSQVWWVDSGPPTSDEQNQLINFAQSGKGVYLTGERPCCEALNDADQSIVNSVVVGGGITVGDQGDVCGCNDPLPVNPNVVGNLATRPHTVTSWQPSAPGGMAGVPDSSVFSYYQPGDLSTRQVVAAAWDRSSTVGNGRLVVFMDINWPEAAWRAPNWSDVAENVAFFLSGLSSPPSPPILQSTATVVPAGPLLFGAQAQTTPARATAPASGGATRSTR